MSTHRIVALAVLVAFGVVPALSADSTLLSTRTTALVVSGETTDGRYDVDPCEGSAPDHDRCVREFRLGPDAVVHHAFAIDYGGAFISRASTSTGTVTTVCAKTAGAAPVCTDWREGTLADGQRVTLVASAPASGFWKVSVTDR